MRIAGIVLLGVGVLSFVGLFTVVPHDASFAGFLIVFSIISLTGGILLPIIGPVIQAQRGPLITGKILEVKKSIDGVKLTVRFKTIDGQNVIASGKAALSQEWVWPGMPIPLRYYPKNPKNIFIVTEDSEEVNRVATAYREKIENGPLVFGTLVSMKPTGAQMDGGLLMERVLRFRTVEGQDVVASHWGVVLEQLQPGVVFPLRYNPEDPEQIITGLGGKEEDEATVQRAIRAYWIANGLTTQEEEDIQECGVKAAGVILSAEPTGNIINGYEEMALHVKVTRPDNGGIYDATVKKSIPPDALAGIQPGSVVSVYYMPEDEENIVVDNVISLTYALH